MLKLILPFQVLQAPLRDHSDKDITLWNDLLFQLINTDINIHYNEINQTIMVSFYLDIITLPILTSKPGRQFHKL